MASLSWCKRRRNGIKCVEVNVNLSIEYYKTAEESLLVLKHIESTGSKVWLAVVQYYALYFAAYSILLRCGILCENHDCTIFLIKHLEKNSLLNTKLAGILEENKGLRIDNQYYLKNRLVITDFSKLSNYLLEVRKELNELDNAKIDLIREKVFS